MLDKKFLLKIATKIAMISEQCKDPDTKIMLQQIVRTILKEADTKLS
ncbi:hypothetical protein [Lysinibacillus pakistanensis]